MVVNVSVPICGNGVVEGDEQCDCPNGDCSIFGLNAGCCNATTCKLTAGSVCAGQQGCCESCQVASKGTLCRASTGFCDLTDYCDGISADCTDNRRALGTICPTADNRFIGNCGCTGCLSLSDHCYTRDPNWYAPCYTSGDAACGVVECKKTGVNNACYFFAEDYAEVGMPCGSGLGCNSSHHCVPYANVNCDPSLIFALPTNGFPTM